MRAIHLEVTGRVQGVGFRWFVRERARSLAVAGWVRNLADGGVEIAARGSDDAVAQLVEHVRRGPPGAMVRAIHERVPPAQTDYPDPFTVKR